MCSAVGSFGRRSGEWFESAQAGLRRLRWRFLGRGSSALAPLLLLLAAMLIAAVTHALGSGELWPSREPGLEQWLSTASYKWGTGNWRWPWRRRRSPLWLVSGRVILFALALLACAVASASRNLAPETENRPRSQVRPRAVMPSRVHPSDLSSYEEAEAVKAFSALRAMILEGDELRACIALESWGSRKRPLRRHELQILLEEAAKEGQVALIRTLATLLEQTGVALDWAAGYDCTANFGRHALDLALEAAVKQSGDEGVAIAILDLGLASGSGSTEKLDVNPLLRAAAGQGMLSLVDRLVKCGADVNGKDPLFGSTALDRAADAGRSSVALRLLRLGASPHAGRGTEYLLSRLTDGEVQKELLNAARAPASQPAPSLASPVAPVSLSSAELEVLRRRMRSESERQALATLARERQRGAVMTTAEILVLMEDSIRGAYQPSLLRALAALCPRLQLLRLLDAALRTAVEEGPNDLAALFLLDLRGEEFGGARGEESRSLNVAPLLRIAASRCMPRLLEALLSWASAGDINASDPNFGGTALDRALAGNCHACARLLLDAGAKPSASS